MLIASISFRLYAPWVHTLKEKRMIVKSLVAKLQNKFNVSAAEIAEQDIHQIIVIGVAAIVPDNAFADSLMDEISGFVESSTDAEMLDEEREISKTQGGNVPHPCLSMQKRPKGRFCNDIRSCRNG